MSICAVHFAALDPLRPTMYPNHCGPRLAHGCAYANEREGSPAQTACGRPHRIPKNCPTQGHGLFIERMCTFPYIKAADPKPKRTITFLTARGPDNRPQRLQGGGAGGHCKHHCHKKKQTFVGIRIRIAMFLPARRLSQRHFLR